VIVSDQAELGGTAPVRPTSATQKLDQLLPRAAQNPDFSNQLAALHIKYILLDREENYQDYDYLKTADGFRQVANQGTLELYQNERYGETHEAH